MNNEILLILNLVFVYGAVLLFYRLFGKTGLYCWVVFATLMANIEVLIVVDAFGLRQTLGNILFASTFTATDILSENHGKKPANKAVLIGIAVSAAFIVLSVLWLSFTPSEVNSVFPAFKEIFSQTPGILLAGFGVYAISQLFDVWIYHKLWDRTYKSCGDRKSLLWLRNNGATLLSQLINAVLFNALAFGGVYDSKTLIAIIVSTYLIYIVTSILDTPIVYIARNYKAEKQGQ